MPHAMHSVLLELASFLCGKELATMLLSWLAFRALDGPRRHGAAAAATARMQSGAAATRGSQIQSSWDHLMMSAWWVGKAALLPIRWLVSAGTAGRARLLFVADTSAMVSARLCQGPGSMCVPVQEPKLYSLRKGKVGRLREAAAAAEAAFPARCALASASPASSC